MEYKSITGEVADVDIASRRVKLVGSEMGSVDLDNDIMDLNSFQKSITERGPKGSNSIYWLQDHNPSIGNGLIGKFSELYTEGNKLIGIGIIPKTTIGNNILTHYEQGNINGHSIGFSAISVEKGKGNGPRIIKEAKLYEISSVLFPAHPNTPTLSVSKSGIEIRETKTEMLCKQLALLHSEIRSSQHKADSELLTYWFQQLMDEIKGLRLSTEAEENSPMPDNNKFLIESISKLNGLFGDKDTRAAKAEKEKKKAELRKWQNLRDTQGTLGRLNAKLRRV